MSDGIRKEFLNVNIDLPSFRLELQTSDPTPALANLRKILEKLDLTNEVVYEEFVEEELKAVFSETFIENPQVMGAIKKLLKLEEDYRVSATEIPMTIDLDGNAQVEKRQVQHAIACITRTVEPASVKHGIIHINGDLGKEHKLLIVDHIHKYMPTAQLRAFHSKGDDGKVVVECIFFGDFPEEDE